MTTAEFPQEKFLAYGRAVRAVLPPQMRLVANVGILVRPMLQP